MISIFYIQVIGLLGFLFILLAPVFSKRKILFLTLDTIGLIPVAIHYILLDRTSAALLCVLYFTTNIVSAMLPTSDLSRKLYWALYPLALALLAVSYVNHSDLLALFGTFAAIAARQRYNLSEVYTLIAISCIGWGTYGFFVSSYAQMIFSSFYFIASVWGVWQQRK